MLYDEDVWPTVADDDLWIFDKLILSRKLGHLCGPAGVDVPAPNNYVVRPCVNLCGMGRGARIDFIEKQTSHLPPGFFWQQIFVGRHLSIDYEDGKQIRCTQGIKDQALFTRFTNWTVTDDKPVISPIIQDIINRYPRVNVEMIGGKIIEVHLRGNPDFDDGAIEAIPIWRNTPIECPSGYIFVDQPDGDRIGFFKKYT